MGFVNADQARAWVVGETDDFAIASQDGPWAVADGLPFQQWFLLFNEPNAIPKRRDEIAYVICILFQDHFDPNSTWRETMSPEEREEEFKQLSDFILQNWQAFYGTAQEPAMGGDFDETLLPLLRARFGDAITEREPRMPVSSANSFLKEIDRGWLNGYAVGILVAIGLAIFLQMPTEKLLIQIAAWIVTWFIFYAICRHYLER